MTKREVDARGPGKRASGTVLAALILVALMALPVMAQLGRPIQKREITEIFHVSRVGQGGAAEKREVLLAIYEKVASSYNEKIRRDEQRAGQIYKGERVRVIRRLDDADENGPLFLVAYNGGPSVMSVKGNASLSPGDLSPPLIVTEAGQHTMEITRRIRVRNKTEREPALEVVDKSTTGVPTFFGIPVGGGGGGSSSSNSAPSSPPRSQPPASSGPTYRTVTDTQTLNKFVGTISTERLAEGPPKMSTDLFVKQLKNGEVFDVSQDEKRRCQECRGFGRVKTTKPIGFRDPDGKMVCPNCQAIGKVDWDVTYRVMW